MYRRIHSKDSHRGAVSFEATVVLGLIVAVAMLVVAPFGGMRSAGLLESSDEVAAAFTAPKKCFNSHPTNGMGLDGGGTCGTTGLGTQVPDSPYY